MVQIIGMDEIAAFFRVVLYICGCIGIIAGAVAVIAALFGKIKKSIGNKVKSFNLFGKIKKPSNILRDQVEAMENHMKDIDKFLQNDKESIDKLTDKINDLIKIELAHLDHQIDGNGIEQMKKIGRELQLKI